MGILAVPSLRAARSLSEARSARARHQRLAEVEALDRALLEAPPFLRGLRRTATARLEVIAGGEDAAAWYAVLSLTSATRGASRAAWQRRATQLAGSGPGTHSPMKPLIPTDPTAPSPPLSALSTVALLGWILASAAILTARTLPRRPIIAAAALLWLLWLLTLSTA